MYNPYSQQARDTSGESLPEFVVPRKAVSVFGLDNGAASSIMTLSDNATTVEVLTGASAAVYRWVPSTETAAAPAGSVFATANTGNYDGIIPPNYFRRLSIPIERVPTPSNLSGGSNSRNGLYNRIAIRTLGIGSVLTVQYP